MHVQPINIRFKICVYATFIINTTPESVELDISEFLFRFKSETN
jgi:hypothetical protein